jgi:hypothetical protein
MFKMFFCFCILIVNLKIYAQTPVQLPENGLEYETYRDASISDEFNECKLDSNKWTRRNSSNASIQDYHTDKSLVQIEKELSKNGEKIQFVSIKATAPNQVPRTAGLVSVASAFYGFYTVRFRFRGFDTQDVRERGSIWHPSVWAGITNHNQDIPKKSVKNPKYWTEIDFMEWENGANGWSSDAPSRFVDSKGVKRKVITKGKGAEKAIMTKGPFKTHDPVWQTIGLEYTPEYFKLWEWKNGKWVHLGKRIVHFVDDSEVSSEVNYTISTIGKKARQPVFWILGNIVAGFVLKKIDEGTNKHTMNDLSVDFDFFRYYRHKKTKKLNWPWENNFRKGSNKIEKDDSIIQVIK